MTAPSYALSATDHLAVADRLICEQVNRDVLLQHDMPVGARVYLALAALEEWVNSPRSMRLASARDAEIAALAQKLRAS